MSLQSPPLSYFLTLSETSLESFELSRLTSASNLRKEMNEVVEEWVEAEVQARLARLIRQGERFHPSAVEAAPTPIAESNFEVEVHPTSFPADASNVTGLLHSNSSRQSAASVTTLLQSNSSRPSRASVTALLQSNSSRSSEASVTTLLQSNSSQPFEASVTALLRSSSSRPFEAPMCESDSSHTFAEAFATAKPSSIRHSRIDPQAPPPVPLHRLPPHSRHRAIARASILIATTVEAIEASEPFRETASRRAYSTPSQREKDSTQPSRLLVAQSIALDRIKAQSTIVVCPMLPTAPPLLTITAANLTPPRPHVFTTLRRNVAAQLQIQAL